jgi:hypothetical protein
MDTEAAEALLESQRQIVARLQERLQEGSLTGSGENAFAEALKTQVETLRHLHALANGRVID